MLKNKSKVLILFVIFLLIISTISFGTDNSLISSGQNTVSNTVDGTDNSTTSSTPEIRNSDLYVFDNNIEMNELVDGNVFLFGRNITVNGKVNGSLYACGDQVTFGKDAYVVQSIFVAANKVTMNGSTTDFYALASQVDMSYEAFAIRDLKVAANVFNFSGGAGRDATVGANQFNFNTDAEHGGIIYGNLNYTSPSELSLSKEFVQGNITYTPDTQKVQESMGDKILDLFVSFCNTLLIVLVIYFLCLWLAPKFLQRSSNYLAAKEGLTSFGIGILGSIITVIVIFGMLFTVIGMPIAFMLLGLFILMLFIANAITCICITHKIKEQFHFSKNYLTYVTLVLTVLVIWALKFLPYVGWIIGLIVTMLGFGIIIHYQFTKNRDKKTIVSNDKTVKEESKKINKKDENK